MSLITLRAANAPLLLVPLVTAAEFRALVLAVWELQQIAIEGRAKVEEFQRKHRTGLLTLLFTDIVDSIKLKQTFGDREAVHSDSASPCRYPGNLRPLQRRRGN
jgi:hypothetical protein